MTVDLNLGYSQLILKEAVAANLSVAQQAYVLATAYWETNRTVLPVEEAYYLGSRAEAYRRKLRYYPWHGRGFVQLTWERNYIRAAAMTGADLIGKPELAMDPEIAAKVLVIGSRDGWFTGRRLAEFSLFGKFDFVGARRIINGTDCAAQIAAIATEYEDALTPAPDYPFLRRGSTGAAVVTWQGILSAHGFEVAADGHFGPRTDAETRTAQGAAGLKADGIVGPATWAHYLKQEA